MSDLISDVMSEERSIPYPRGLARGLLRLPIGLYRLGLGEVMNAAHIMILGTRGRKSGLARYTAIEYRRHGSHLYVVSAWGERPQWFRNLQASGAVLVQQGRRAFGARAEVVTDSGEALRVLHLFRRTAPYLYDPLIARMSDRAQIDERTLPEVSRAITIIRLDPTPDAPPDLPPLRADFVWVWPLALVLALLLISLTRSRPHEDA